MTATRNAGRECTQCPPWVVRCAHWDGQTLVISSDVIFLESPCPAGRPHHREYAEYVVGNAAPRHGGCMIMDNVISTDDLPSAEAEFYKRERELLGHAD